MTSAADDQPPPPPLVPRPASFLMVAGAYLSLRGYHAFDGDQAYRLPLLLHRQDPSVYAADPFVRAFDAFNPHRGYLTLLDLAARPLGLAAGLVALFALTLAGTMIGVDRLARAVWPGAGGRVGLVAVALVLLAKAGNIGTNHLFEGTLLDRLVAFALGWLALAAVVADPRRGWRRAAPTLGLAAVVHPSVGLQLSLTLMVAALLWGVVGERRSGVTIGRAAGAIGLLGLALVPGLILIAGQGGRFLEGMPLAEFRHWAVEVQGPQHMLPRTWRLPQWLAFGCYPVLAALAWVGRDRAGARAPAATRFGLLVGVNLASLVAAYVAVEVAGDLRVTVGQPFRMATLARGLCLVALADRIRALWDRGDLAGRARAVTLAVALTGDWTLVVATAAELVAVGVAATGLLRHRATPAWVAALVAGIGFLIRHDTEGGDRVLLLALGATLAGTGFARVRPLAWNRRRVLFALGAAWAVPLLAAGVEVIGGASLIADHAWAEALARRCRFAQVPVDDLERVARWCRDHTPGSSRFIGPPGEKGFRLWSRRALVFNRAGSPYHAAGLRDWSERFRDHVGFLGTPAEFARAYLDGRHRLEANYDRMMPLAKLALAHRQGADHVLERLDSDRAPAPDLGPGLELVHRLGRYVVYRVRPPVTGEAPGDAPARTGSP